MAVRVAVVGAGYMGSAHARVLSRIAREHPGLVELAYIVDVDRGRAGLAAARYGGRPLERVGELPRDSVDLAIVAVPTRHHYRVAVELLERGVRGLLVEKPLAASLEEAARLVEAVEEAGAWAAVGHVERFNPAVWALHRLAARGLIGEPLTLVARRVGPFAPRAGDTDVVYDLGVHEADNALALALEAPGVVRAYTLGRIVSGLNDYALLVLGFTWGYASLEVNRITPFKQRLLYLTGSRGTATLDYMAQELRLYTELGETRVRVEKEEPLYLEDLHALAALQQGRSPLVDIHQGLAAMLVCAAGLEAAVRGRDLALEETSAYRDHGQLLARALEGYRRYREAVEACSGPRGCAG